jgi:transcriptional regulator with XRE-family HTH domain
MPRRRSRSSSPVDDFVGVRIRERRRDLGLSSHQFAEKIGVSHPQAIRYERGLDRIFAGRLWEIADALGAPPDYFYEGFDAQEPRRAAAHPGRHKYLEMVRHLDGIRDEKHLEAIGLVVRALAGR